MGYGKKTPNAALKTGSVGLIFRMWPFHFRDKKLHMAVMRKAVRRREFCGGGKLTSIPFTNNRNAPCSCGATLDYSV